MILGFNRRLIWVVVPTVLWCAFGLLVGLGAAGPPLDGGPEVNIGVGRLPGVIIIHGRLVKLTESADGVSLVVQRTPLPPDAEGMGDPAPPAGVTVEYLDAEPIVEGPPSISVLSPRRPLRFPGGRGVVTENYVIHHTRSTVRIVPKGMAREFLQRMQQDDERDQRRGPRPDGERRGGPRGERGGQPPPQPPEEGRQEPPQPPDGGRRQQPQPPGGGGESAGPPPR